MILALECVQSRGFKLFKYVMHWGVMTFLSFSLSLSLSLHLLQDNLLFDYTFGALVTPVISFLFESSLNYICLSWLFDRPSKGFLMLDGRKMANLSVYIMFYSKVMFLILFIYLHIIYVIINIVIWFIHFIWLNIFNVREKIVAMT